MTPMLAALPAWFDGVARDLTIIAGVIVAVGVIWRGVVRPVLRYARRLEATVADVQGEFRNNGGSTLRDAVDRIDQRTSHLEAWRESVDARLSPAPAPKPRAPRKKAE